MATPLYEEIRSRLASALARKTTLREFHRWFVPATWGIRPEEDPDAAELTFAIEHLFAERSAGDLTIAAMRQELADLLVARPAVQSLTGVRR